MKTQKNVTSGILSDLRNIKKKKAGENMTKREVRLSMRIDADTKKLLEYAAKKEHRTMTNFVMAAALKEAEKYKDEFMAKKTL